MLLRHGRHLHAPASCPLAHEPLHGVPALLGSRLGSWRGSRLGGGGFKGAVGAGRLGGLGSCAPMQLRPARSHLVSVRIT